MNIYADRKFGWNWQQHIDNGYLGGDDMKTAPGEDVFAPVAGLLTRTLHSATITETDGWKTQALELASTAASRIVKVGDKIGTAGTKWVHWHSLDPAKTRHPARFLNPPPAKENNHMRHLLKYTSATPDMWIEIDFLDHTYTLIAPGSFEDAVVNNDVAAGRRWDEIADPDWGQSFGNGQYRNITKPDTPSSANDDYAALAKAVNDDAARRLAS